VVVGRTLPFSDLVPLAVVARTLSVEVVAEGPGCSRRFGRAGEGSCRAGLGRGRG